MGKSNDWFHWPLWFLAGIAAALTAAQAIASWRDLVPDIEPYRVLKYASDLPKDAPVCLFVGSSYTQYGLDIALFEKEVAALGKPCRVVRFAYGGLSLVDRRHYLREMVARTGVRPAAVFMEVNEFYDRVPMHYFLQNPDTMRSLDIMDLGSTAQALHWAWTDQSQMFGQRAVFTARLIGTFVRRYLNGDRIIGARFLPFESISAGTEPAAEQRAQVLSQEVLDRRLKVLAKDAEENLPVAALPWAEDEYYAALQADFRLVGTTRFGFYAMPTTVPAELPYARDFCRRHSGELCLTPDPRLKDFADIRYWYDYAHLHHDGREIVTRWLAAALTRQD